MIDLVLFMTSTYEAVGPLREGILAIAQNLTDGSPLALGAPDLTQLDPELVRGFLEFHGLQAPEYWRLANLTEGAA
ncbi:MAG: hypothetical protein AAF724_04765 [Pseudomonadota bacterium]